MIRIIQPDKDFVCSENCGSLVRKILSVSRLDEKRLQEIFHVSEHVSDALCLKKTAERLKTAQEKKEKVFVFGDYDADGICATSLMCRLLDKLSLTRGFYIPNRLKEGYGITSAYVHLAKEKGYQLIVTVDNGVSAYEALDEAEKLEIDVLVIDHHIRQEKERDPKYLIHPDLLEAEFADLCGAGCVLQLIRHMEMAEPKDWVLAMVATIGDMVSVFGENRNIIQKGLQILNKGLYPNIACLSKKTVFNESDIAFDIVPKLNTYGRLADRANAYDLVRYLLLEDTNSILYNAGKIEELNNERKKLVSECVQSPHDFYQTANYDIYVSEYYHEGIIGLLANRMMNEKHRPSLVFAKGRDLIKGSGRSMKGYDIFENISKYKDMLESFGGHEQACGLSLLPESWEAFLNRLEQEEAIAYEEEVDTALAIEMGDLTLKNMRELEKIRPFGMGFFCPDFYLKELPVSDSIPLKNNYRKTVSDNQGESLETMCFQSAYLAHLNDKGWHDIIVSAAINRFRMRQNVSLIVEKLYVGEKEKML